LIGGASALALTVSAPALAQDYGSGGEGGQTFSGVDSGIQDGGEGGDGPNGEDGGDGIQTPSGIGVEGGGGGGGAAGITGGAGGDGAQGFRRGVTVAGGAGGAGGATPGAAGQPGANGEDSGAEGAGGGGGGAHGGVTSFNNQTITGGAFVGGNGGKGGNAGGGTAVGGSGGGGQGGYGLLSTRVNGNLKNDGSTVTGGDGGDGGSRTFSGGGDGGTGGIGIAFTGAGNTFTNNGTVTGGDGGNADLGSFSAPRGASGSGGVGIIGTNLTVINDGSISGGLSGFTADVFNRFIRANAVTFGAGDNIYEHRAGGSVTGNVVGDGDDLFRLGGDTDGSFAVGQFGSTYQGFATYQKTGISFFTLTGTTTQVTPWTISGGALVIVSDAALGATSGDLTLTGGGILLTEADITSARNVGVTGTASIGTAGNTAIFNGSFSGGGLLNKTGTGTLVLNGDNSARTGQTSLVAGTLRLGNSAALGSGVLAARTASTIDYAGGVVIANPITIGLVSGTNLTLNQTGGAAEQSGVISDGGNTYGITKTGSGNLTLSGANSYGGTTTVAGGTLTVTTNNGLGTAGAGTTVLDGATLAFNGANLTIGEAISVTGSGANGGGALRLNGGSTLLSEQVTLTGDTLVLALDGTLNLAGGVSGEHDLTVEDTDTSDRGRIRLGALDIGSGDLTVNRIAAAFDAGNSFTGNVLVNSSTLDLVAGGASTIDDRARVTLDVPFFGYDARINLYQDETIGSLAGTRGFVVAVDGDRTFTLGGDDTSTSFGGEFLGSLSLVKTGGGTFTLTRTDGFQPSGATGGVTIRGGTLAIFDDRSLGADSGALTFDGAGATLQTLADLTSSRNIALTSGGIFNTDAGTSATFSGIVSGNGSLAKAGAGTLVLTGANTYSGGTLLDAGTIRVRSNSALGTNGLTAADGTTLDFAAAITIGNNIVTNGTLTLNQSSGSSAHTGAITGAGGITKTGAGSLRLSGNQLYDGVTRIAGGVLIADSDFSLGTTIGNTIVENGATLDLQGLSTSEAITISGAGVSGLGALRNSALFATLNGRVTLAAGATIASGGSTLQLAGGIDGNHDLTLNSASQIQVNSDLAIGNGNLTIDGGGIVALRRSNSFTGDVTVANGLLITGADDGNVYNTIGDAAALTLRSGSTWRLAQSGETIGSLAGSGYIYFDGVRTPGRIGRLTVGGANTSTSFAGQINEQNNGVLSLTKVGTGTLTLSGASTYSGGTVLSEGTLGLGSSNALGTGTLQAANGTGLTLANGVDIANAIELTGNASGAVSLGVGSGEATVSGIIRGSAGVLKVDPGTLVLTGANTYSGGTTISGGTIAIASDAALGDKNGAIRFTGATGTLRTTSDFTLSRDIVLDGSGTISTDAGTTATMFGYVRGTGNLTKSGAGTLTLSDGNTYSGDTFLTGGTVRLLGDDALGTGQLVASGGTTISYGGINTIANAVEIAGNVGFNVNSGTGTQSGVISGSGAMTKTGAGTLTLSGENTYTGGTTLSLGTLALQNSSALGTNGLTAANGTTIRFGDGVNIANGVNVLNNVTLNQAAGTAELSGQITQSTIGTLIKTGAGNLTLSGSSTFNGAVSVREGTVTVASNSALGSTLQGVSVDDGATLAFTGLRTIRDDVLLQGTGVGGLGALRSQGLSTIITGRVSLLGSTLISSEGDGLMFTNFVGAGAGADRDLTVTGSGDTLFGGEVALRGGTLTKNGTGSLALIADNSIDGSVFVNAGTLQIGGGIENGPYDTIGDTARLSIATGATVRLEQANETIGSLVGSGNLQSVVAGGLLTVGGDNTSTTFSGLLGESGAGSSLAIAKTGTGNLTLTGTNTYSGATTVSAGTLTVTNAAALGSTAGETIVQDGATLALDKTNLLGIRPYDLLSENISLSGSGVGGNGALTNVAGYNLLVGEVSLAGATTIGGQAGRLDFIGGVTGTDTDLTLVGGSDIYFTSNFATGNGNLIINSTGRTLLSTDAGIDNDFTGDVTVNAGALEILGRNGASAINDDALLAINGGMVTLSASERIGALSGSGSLVANGNRTLTVGNAQSTTFSGILSENFSTLTLAKTGTGTLTLTGANTYTGATNVQAGTLVVNGDQSAATGLTSVANGATLAGSGIIGGDVTLADGASLNPGTSPGTMTINGSLDLSAGSILKFEFGEAGVAGGALNDLVVVNGDLTLDGILNVTTSAGGSFGVGVYRVFDYGGALIDNGLTLGSTPAGNAFIQTSVANQVNLVNTTGLSFSFWDGAAGANNDAVDGGSGVWQSGAGNANWTDANGALNGAYDDGTFAIFQGTGGTVTVDTSLGDVTVSGLQFVTNGYVVEGGTLTLNGGAESIIRVGDGTAGGAGVTATIAANVSGATQLVKTDLGTLVLSGTNDYTGGTRLEGGVLSLGNANALGGGTLSVADGTGLILANGVDVTNAISLGGNLSVESGGFSQGLSGVVSGNGSLTKTGNGSLTLSGSNTYAGGTALTAGTLILENRLALGTGALAAADGTRIDLAGIPSLDNRIVLNGAVQFAATAGDAFQNGTISGAGSLELVGFGLLGLNGTNTYTGGTTISSGTLAIQSDRALGAASGSLTLGGSLSTLRLRGDWNTSRDIILTGGSSTIDGFGWNANIAGTISGAGGLTFDGAGAVTLSGGNTYRGGTLLRGGTLALQNNRALGTGSLTAADGTSIAYGDGIGIANAIAAQGSVSLVQAGGGATQGGVISGAGDLTKTGTGTLTLSGASTYSGTTTVAAGTLTVANDSALGTTDAGTTVLDGATLALAQANIADDISITGTGVGGRGALVADNGNGTVTGTLTLAGDARTGGNSFLTLFDVDMGAHTLTLGGDAATAIDGNGISGTGNLILDTVAAFRVANSFTGNLDIISGGLVLIASGADTISDNVAVSMADGTILNLAQSETIGSLSGAGTVGTLDNVRSATLTLGGNNLSTTFSGQFAEDRDTPLSIVKNGTGAFTLTGANAYSGGTTLNAGSLVLGNASALGTGTLNAADGTTLGYLANLDVANAITLAGAVTFDRGQFSVTQSGNIGGTGSLIAAGGGTLTLSGNNTYSGGTMLSGGTLAVTTNTALGTGDLTTTDGSRLIYFTRDMAIGNGIVLNGALEVWSDGAATQNGVISGSGSLLTRFGTLSLTGANTFTGGTTIESGGISALNNSALGTGAVTMNDGTGLNYGDGITLANALTLNGTSLLQVDGTGSATQAGAISGSGRLVKQGAGTLELGSANTYTGGTTLSAGTLALGNAQALGSGDLLSAGNVTIALGNGVSIANNAQLFGPTTLNADGSSAFSGQISGSGALVRTGIGTLTLTGANTYSGGTLLNGGATVIGNGNALGTGTITAQGGALAFGADEIALANAIDLQSNLGVDIGSNTVALTGMVSGTGRLFLNGSGALLVSGNNSFTGGTEIASGTIGLLSDAALGTGGLSAAGGSTIAYADDVTIANTLALSGGVTLDQAGGSATQAGRITGFEGSLVKTGAGVLTLTGANTYARGTTLTGGALILGSDSALGTGVLTAADGTALGFTGDRTIGNAMSFAGAVTLDSGTGVTSLGGAISGSGTLAKQGAGTLSLTGDSAYTGTIGVQAGTLRNTGNFAGNVANAATFTNSGTAGAAANSGTLTNSGTLASLYNGANATLTGDSIIVGTVENEGTLALGGQAQSLLQLSGSTTVNMAAALLGDVALQGGTLSIGANGQLTFASLATAAGTTLSLSDGATLRGTGNSTMLGGITNVAAGASLIANGAITNLATGVLTFASGATIDTDADTNGDEAFANAGTVRLAGTNSQIVSVGGNGGNDLSNLVGAQLLVDAGRLDVAGMLANAGNVSLAANGVLNADMLVNASGGSIVNAGTISASSGIANQSGATLSTTGTLAGPVANEGAIGAQGMLNGSLANGGAGLFTLTGDLASNGSDIANSGTAVLDVSGGDFTGIGMLANASSGADGAGGVAGLRIAAGRMLAADLIANSGELLVAGTLAARVEQTAGLLGNIGLITGDTIAGGGLVLGTGAYGGDVTILTGAAIAPGTIGSAATTSIAGMFGLGGTASYDLGTADVIGGATNDLILAGSAVIDGGTFDLNNAGAGSYRLINTGSAGSIAVGEVTLANVAQGSRIYTTGNGQYLNVQVGYLSTQYWDGSASVGDGTVDGGAGVWTNALGATNWTAATGALNNSWQGTINPPVTAVFGGTAGTVSVDTSAGYLGFGAMRFDNDGYVLADAAGDDAPDLGADGTTANVFAGIASSEGGIASTITVTDAASAARIEAGIAGVTATTGLIVDGAGTLELAGNNEGLTGTIAVLDGTLRASGGMAISNASALVLRGDARFEIADDEAIGSLDGSAANSVDLGGNMLLAGFNGDDTTFAGVISGTGSFVKTGEGKMTLTGANTYTGTTGVTGGTLVLGADDVLSDQSFLTVQSATLDLQGNSNTVGAFQLIDGTLAGSGTLSALEYQLEDAQVDANLGTGVLFQTGGTSVLGGTSAADIVAINAGTLRLGASERLADSASVQVAEDASFDLSGATETIAALYGMGIVDLGSGQLTLGGTGLDSGFGGTLLGSGTLAKTGGGIFTLLGDQQGWTGNFNLAAGTLRFFGNSSGGALISGGTLSGNSTFASSLTMTGGTISPGYEDAPIGMISAQTIDLLGGTALFDFRSPEFGGAADALVASGAITISGTQVAIASTDSRSSFPAVQRYAIVQGSSLTGTFANGSTFEQMDNEPQLFWRLRYDLVENGVALEVRRMFDFGANLAEGATPNQIAVATTISSGQLDIGDAFSDAILPLADLAEADQLRVFDSLGGESLTHVTTSAFIEGQRFADLLTRRIYSKALMQADTRSPAKARALAPVSPGEADALAAPDVASLSMWMQGFGGSGSIEGDRVTRGLRHDVSGLAGGIEARYGAFKAGVAGGYSDGSYDVRSLQASMQGEVVHVGGYLGYEGEAAFAGLFGSYVEGDFDSTRRVSAANVRTLTAQAEVDMKGRTLGGFAGYRAPLGNNIVLAPMVGATNIRIKRDGFDETGADPLNLQVSQETREVTYGTAQLRLSSATPVSGGTFEPYLAGGVERYWGDLRAVSTMRFAGAAGDMGSFRIIGAPLEKTVGAFGAGFDVRPNDRIEIGASAGVRVGDRVTQSTVEMHARIRF